MFKFTFPLVQGQDPKTGQALFGFNHAGAFIYDPFMSPCGTTAVSPVETYDISYDEAHQIVRLNDILENAASDNVDAVVKAVYNALYLTGFQKDKSFEKKSELGTRMSQLVAEILGAELGVTPLKKVMPFQDATPQ